MSKDTRGTELMPQSGYLSVSDFNMAEALQEEMDGLSLDFDKVKIPSGGTVAFEMPGDDPDSPETEKEFSGVIVFHHPIRMFYREKYTGGSNPPDCGSMDGKCGVGDPGGICSKCHYNEFGTALDDGNGKGCKERRRIYIMREGEVFPLLLSLPQGSLKNFGLYVRRLLSKRKKASMVVTRFSLKKATNAGGVVYSQAQFAVDRELSTDEQAVISRLAEQVKTQARHIGFEEDADTYSADGPMVDPETGEVIEPLGDR